jgi:predicted GNAT family N-acyltransferase
MRRPTISVNILPWEQAQYQAYPIRLAVFVKEQGVPEELELDEEDPLAWHAIAKLDGQAIGTARLQKDGKIGRMAVIQAYRRQGVASAMMNVLLKFGRQHGINQFNLHAQIEALPFYERFGFVVNGPVFNEAGIAHQIMRKVI